MVNLEKALNGNYSPYAALGLAMWVIAVSTHQPLTKTMLPLSYCSQAIVKLKSYLSFSTSHTFSFICILLHSATTRDLDSSTKEVQVGLGGPANLLDGKGLTRQGHLKLLPSHGPHRDRRIIPTFLGTHEVRKKGGEKKFVNWAGRMVLTLTPKKVWINTAILQAGSILHIH